MTSTEQTFTKAQIAHAMDAAMDAYILDPISFELDWTKRVEEFKRQRMDGVSPDYGRAWADFIEETVNGVT